MFVFDLVPNAKSCSWSWALKRNRVKIERKKSGKKLSTTASTFLVEHKDIFWTIFLELNCNWKIFIIYDLIQKKKEKLIILKKYKIKPFR
jgi:hypothetical protein